MEEENHVFLTPHPRRLLTAVHDLLHPCSRTLLPGTASDPPIGPVEILRLQHAIGFQPGQHGRGQETLQTRMLPRPRTLR
jgi:hypothetical protein